MTGIVRWARALPGHLMTLRPYWYLGPDPYASGEKQDKARVFGLVVRQDWEPGGHFDVMWLGLHLGRNVLLTGIRDTN